MSQREKRIAELRDIVEQNFNSILTNAEEKIKQEGWVRFEDKNFKPDALEVPRLWIRDTGYQRPYGDFLWVLIRTAQERYYVTESTAKSYATLALEPFAAELLNRKYKKKRPTYSL